MRASLNGNTRALVVFNPAAGQAANVQHSLNAACAVWRAAGWKVELRPTRGPGDATAIARAAAQAGYDLVVAAGGDGTVNEVVNGLVGSDTVLGALPIGTVNVWMRELHLPMQPRAAAEALLNARIERVDVGRAGDRYFLLMAGVGFDAAVTAVVRSEAKRRLGVFAYVVQTINVARHWRGSRVQLTIDGKTTRARVVMVVIGNSQLYGGFVKITARASLRDGLLDVCVIRGKDVRSVPLRFISVLTRRYDLDPDLEYHRARQIRISSSRPLPVQVDGDHIGSTPMEFVAIPGALRALVPFDLPDEDLLNGSAPAGRKRGGPLSWLSRRRLPISPDHESAPR